MSAAAAAADSAACPFPYPSARTAGGGEEASPCDTVDDAVGGMVAAETAAVESAAAEDACHSYSSCTAAGTGAAAAAAVRGHSSPYRYLHEGVVMEQTSAVDAHAGHPSSRWNLPHHPHRT